MRIAHSSSEIRQQLQALRSKKTIAFVPTMGCLHRGHLSLIQQAKVMADIVVVSIYVNPLQFGPGEDLDQYPRPFEADAQLCAEVGVDFIFHPSTLYPSNGSNITLRVQDRPDRISDCLCGTSRPGHFDGVATAVNILFNIIQPDMAIFGEKDWQQLTILRRMVSDLHMPIEIIAAPTIRESDGLALSSRNRYLNPTERQQALTIVQALRSMQAMAAAGECHSDTLKDHARAILKAANIQPEYLEICHAHSLQAQPILSAQACRAFIAARIGQARLIDNMPLKTPEISATGTTS